MNEITLLDGRTLSCSPRQERVETRWRESEEALSENKRQFRDNVHRFIRHADTILSDSRLFLSPVGFYTSIGPTAMPCLGAFVEWWLNRVFPRRIRQPDILDLRQSHDRIQRLWFSRCSGQSPSRRTPSPLHRGCQILQPYRQPLPPGRGRV